MIHAITFDAVGTLFAPAEPVGVTYAHTATRFGIPADAAAVETAFRHALAAAPPLAFPGVAASELESCELAWWKRVVRSALGSSGRHAAFDACFDTLFAHYATASAWRVYPDVLPTLAAVRAQGLSTAVVSNFDGRLPALMDALGLSAAMDAIVWSTRVGAAKPAPAIFEAAAAALGVPLGAICHVGDDLLADIGGASAAGAHALHLDRTGRAAGGLSTVSEVLSRHP